MSVIDPSLPWNDSQWSEPSDNSGRRNKLGTGYVPGDLGIVDTLDEALELAAELRGITYVATERG